MKLQNKPTRDYLYLLILSITTIYTWFPLTNLILQWESYTYMTRRFYLPLFTNPLYAFANFDVQSMLTGSILSKLIGLNMPMYFWLEIFSILIINICVYFLIKTLTKNSVSGFIASFIFSVYFFGTEFFAPNYYATFVQRIILNVPLLLISFMFLHRYLTEKIFKYYTLSLCLFILSLFLAHFGILFSFHIFVYPIFWQILSSFRFRSFLRGLLISFPYILTAVFFWQLQKVYGEVLEPKESLVYFLTHPETYHYVEGAIRQLVHMSQYVTVINSIISYANPFAYVDPTSTYQYILPIIITYIACSIIIWKKSKNHRALLLTIISGMAMSLITNIYLGRFDFLNGPGLNRYYYYPSLLFAIFWSLLLTALMSKKTIIVIGILLIGFFLVNASLFRQYFRNLQRAALPTKTIYQYLMNNFDQLPANSLVFVGPAPVFGPYETHFFTEQLGEKRGIKFCTENPAYQTCKTLELTATNIVNLHYDKTCACVQKEIIR